MVGYFRFQNTVYSRAGFTLEGLGALVLIVKKRIAQEVWGRKSLSAVQG